MFLASSIVQAPKHKGKTKTTGLPRQKSKFSLITAETLVQVLKAHKLIALC